MNAKFILPSLKSFPSRKEWEKAIWKRILKSGGILDSLVTANERHNIVMRAAAMNDVSSGKTYAAIARELLITPQTVSSAKKAVATSGNYRSYRERGKTERKKKIYSMDPSRRKEIPLGRIVRTKYGKMILPL